MEPKKVGRALGIGVRVASRMVQERVAAASNPPLSQNTTASLPRPASSATPVVPAEPARRGSSSGAAHSSSAPSSQPSSHDSWTAGAKRGLSAFFKAFLGPFSHAGSILWLEITGLFFALFTLFFVQSVYRTRGSWRSGPDHMHLLLYLLLAVGFAWFSASSFVRARRKSRRGRG